MTEEASQLARKYIDEKAIGKGKITDAQHIAIETIHRVDVLISWNFTQCCIFIKIKGI